MQGFRRRFDTHRRDGTAFDPIYDYAPNGPLHVFLIARTNEGGGFTVYRYKVVNGKRRVDKHAGGSKTN